MRRSIIMGVKGPRTLAPSVAAQVVFGLCCFLLGMECNVQVGQVNLTELCYQTQQLLVRQQWRSQWGKWRDPDPLLFQNMVLWIYPKAS